MMDKTMIDKCLQEVNLLKKVSHPNIVKYLDSFISQNELYIAIEWADKGDVKRLIKKYQQEGDLFEESRVIEYARQIASALIHMHDKRVIHRDLKPANILIFSDGAFKLGDLGLGRSMSDETFKAFSRVGTPLYMAPEVISNNGYDFKSDNWSLGCVVYELITLKSPFQTDEKISVMDLFKKIHTGQYPKIKDPKYITSTKLVEALLKVNPEERIDLSEVIRICEDYISKQEEKPKVDPFIIMDDIFEKLRLLDYETNFCEKYNKELITKYYFACLMNNSSNSETYPVQFAYFYELCNWLIMIIKQYVKLEILREFDLKIKRYDKKKTQDVQMADLLNDLKFFNIIETPNSQFKSGYGEKVCIVINKLCDNYLVKQNFIFKKPKFKEHSSKVETIKTRYDDIVLEENIGTNIGFKANTNYNFGGNFKRTGSAGSKGKFFSTTGRCKRFNSAFCQNDDETNNTTAYSIEDDYKSPNTMILQTTIEPGEWNNEFMRVAPILEIPEYPEFFESQSEGSLNANVAISTNIGEKSIKKLHNWESWFNSIIGCFEYLNTIHEKINSDLKKISYYEKKLLESSKLKASLTKLSSANKSNSHYKDECEGLRKSISSLMSEQEVIKEKIEQIKVIDTYY